MGRLLMVARRDDTSLNDRSEGRRAPVAVTAPHRAYPRAGALTFGLSLLLAPPALAETEGTDAPPPAAESAPPSKPAPSGFGSETIFGRPLEREGFHFHVSFGVGSGPSIAGLYHAMEIGWSFSGYTVALLHTFIQYKDVFGPSGSGPDEIGGFMAQLTGPLYFKDLTWKFAAGVGGTVDQPEGEFNANPGFGVHYGVDLHFPIWPKFGPTLSLAAMNVVERGNHHFGAGLALGVTVF